MTEQQQLPIIPIIPITKTPFIPIYPTTTAAAYEPIPTTVSEDIPDSDDIPEESHSFIYNMATPAVFFTSVLITTAFFLCIALVAIKRSHSNFYKPGPVRRGKPKPIVALADRASKGISTPPRFAPSVLQISTETATADTIKPNNVETAEDHIAIDMTTASTSSTPEPPALTLPPKSLVSMLQSPRALSIGSPKSPRSQSPLLYPSSIPSTPSPISSVGSPSSIGSPLTMALNATAASLTLQSPKSVKFQNRLSILTSLPRLTRVSSIGTIATPELVNAEKIKAPTTPEGMTWSSLDVTSPGVAK
ncbi:hypothetical protein HDU97_009710 [Phlyctochytrium planicorne]|nr:hypothetical protein HDU97_009710 [Phlyctochytrium planicorne]